MNNRMRLVGHFDNIVRATEKGESGFAPSQVAFAGNATMALGANHYLLFEKGKKKPGPEFLVYDILRY